MGGIEKRVIKRCFVFLMIFLFVSVVIISSLFKLQILGYDDYQKSVLEQLTVETKVNPNRGEIFDRNGNILASNKTTWILYILPKKIENPEQISKDISEILNLNYEKVLKKAENRSYKYQIIDNSLNEEETAKIREYIDKNSLSSQLQLSASATRYYPFNSLASHTLGFVNADGVGIYGLEKVYNNILEGTSGKYITAQDAQSNDMPFQYEEYIEDENGYNIVSTIDLYIQYQLQAQLEMASVEAGANNRSAGIVMDPQTGEILAMAVYPSFDLNSPYTLDAKSQEKLNKYTKGTKEYNNEYLNLLFSMWNNKAVTELYEPGSTFKLVTTSVALQERVAKTTDLFNCSGALKIDGFYRAISCHKRTGHGTLNFREALQQSCNPSMMNLAFRIGKESFYSYFQKFGYTQKTGIDLPSESTGYYHSYDDFSNVSLAVYSFGQTFKTTAIQQLRAISAVGNGGYLVTPHLLKEVVDDNGNIIYENNIKKEKILDTEVCNTISEILKEGVDGSGGAKNAYVAGYSIAAKTGTSEKKDKFDPNGNTSYRVSSCVAYAPADNPQVAIILMVDEPSVGSAYGSVVAAPYISNLMELILPYLGIEASYSDKDHELVTVPSFVGNELTEAEKSLKNSKISYEIIGEGTTVLNQMPKAGSEIFKKDGKIILYTDSYNESYIKVPNIIGKTAEEANEILIDAGFNISINGALNYKYGQGATVKNQYPIAGNYLKRGDVVTVEVLFGEESD